MPSPTVLFASAPLVVPMRLKLSDLKLRAIIVLVVSRQKGITLVFKNDPLESVNVSSSFDSVGVIQGYIQREIEAQLRELFRSDLPSIIHRLSQRWLTETSTLSTNGFGAAAKVKTETAFSTTTPAVVSEPIALHPNAVKQSPRKGRPSKRPLPIQRSPSELADLSVAECIEAYDPTYGMRFDSLNPFHHSPTSLKQFGSLWDSAESQGMKDALPPSEADGEVEADEDDVFSVRGSAADTSVTSITYETLPAVGGGSITRPRILHSQSQIILPRPSSSLYRESTSVSEAKSAATGPSTVRPQPLALAALRRHSAQYSNHSAPPLGRRAVSLAAYSMQSPTMPPTPSIEVPDQPRARPNHMARASSYVGPPRSRSARSLSSETARTEERDGPSRAPSSSHSAASSPLFPSRMASSFTSLPSSRSLSPVQEKNAFQRKPQQPASPPPFIQPANLSAVSFDTSGEQLTQELPEGITVDSRKNDLSAHISTLSRNFQTLSPFTREVEHFTARSFPRAKATSSLASHSRAASVFDASTRVPGQRKRLHKIGKAAAKESKPAATDSERRSSHTPSYAPTMDDARSQASSVSISDYFQVGRHSSARPISHLGLR